MPLGVFYGRMNPFTRGHMSVLEAIRKNNRTPVLIVTHTQNSEKNPLTVNEKIAYMRNALKGNKNVRLYSTNKKKTLFAILNNLKKENENIKVWLGSNRIPTIGAAITKQGYKLAQLGNTRKNVANNNNRNTPVTNISAMSASRVRKAALGNKPIRFRSMLPQTTSNEQSRRIYTIIRNRIKTVEKKKKKT